MRSALRRRLFELKLAQQAREDGRALVSTMEFWFRRKYNLPPTDPRFLEMTIADIAADYWAHRFTDKPSELNSLVDDSWNEDDIEAEFAAEAEAEAAAALNHPDQWETLN